MPLAPGQPDTRAASAEALAKALGLPFEAELAARPASARFVELVPIHYARQHTVLGLAPRNPEVAPGSDRGSAPGSAPESGSGPSSSQAGGRPDGPALEVAFATEAGFEALDVLGRLLGRPVSPVVATAAAIQRAINAAYQEREGQARQAIERLEAVGAPGGWGGGGGDLAEAARRLAEGDVTGDAPGGASGSSARSSGWSSGGGATGGGGREDLLDVAARAPVIQLVNLLLFEAVMQGASDVHVQPGEDRVAVRLRIDGVLFDAFDLPKRLQDEIVSRIKVMGRMNIAEKRLAQDGRATVRVGDRVVDLRLSSLPTSHGERVVVRLLDKDAKLYTLDDLGMPPEVDAPFRRLIHAEHGLVLVTGPTGSGKSTTLYAALQELDTKELNVLTLEDPIEYQLPGISQTQVSDRKGMTFASGLRSVLRQDPDIIMVGEVRDRETAVMAIQSALTGHLVFSTLHTNDAASAMTRLLDLGIEPYLAASSVLAVLAQRLVRRVCVACQASRDPASRDREGAGTDASGPRSAPGLRPGTEELIDASGPGDSVDPHLALPAPSFRGRSRLAGESPRFRGCPACRGTGYRGRLGLFELLVVDDAVRRCVQERASSGQIKAAAQRAGMRPLQDHGLAMAAAGLTTREEVLRVTVRTGLELDEEEEDSPQRSQRAQRNAGEEEQEEGEGGDRPGAGWAAEPAGIPTGP